MPIIHGTSSSSPLKMLYVGQLSHGGTCRQRLEALRSLGHHIDECDSKDAPSRRKPSQLWHRIRSKLGVPSDTIGLNQRIVSLATNAYDIVWLDKALSIWPETLLTVKEIHPSTQIVGYSPDDMAGRHNQSRYFLNGLKHYDIFFTTKSFNVIELQQLGCRRVVFTPKSYDPATHRPMHLSDSERSELGAPIGFIGTYESERANSVLNLVRRGIPVRLYGDGWDQLTNESRLLTISGPSLYGDIYAKIICSFDINLGFLRKLNRDKQTARSIEIPACGAFLLAERTDEHLNLFTEGKEAEFFETDEELYDKTQFYLRNPQRRKQIAAAGLQRCQNSGYSHQDRLQSMIQTVLRYRQEKTVAEKAA